MNTSSAKKHKKPTSFLRRHRLSISTILLACLVVIGGLYATHTQALELINKNASSIDKMHAETAKIHADAQAKKSAQIAQKQEDKPQETTKSKPAETPKKQPVTTTPSTGSAQQGQLSSCRQNSSHSDPNSTDVVVNKKNCLVPLKYAPSDLVTVDSGVSLRSEAANKYRQMVTAAAAAGYSIGASSGYRSYATQEYTYNYWVQVNGSTAAADAVSAHAGFSEHQTGLAVDVKTGDCSLDCFTNTSAYPWIRDHAHEYGFIERYKAGYTGITGFSPESWHYRYVGTSVSTDMKARGINTLEQYYGLPAAPNY